jgi:hypothetical protein
LTVKIKQKGSLGSVAEDLFVELFCDTFGPEQSEYLFLQYPVTDIYGNRRSIDFALESENLKIAIEIDGETYHNPNKVSSNKYYDDLTKQNSLIYQNWKVYRWVYNQLKHHPEKVKDELRIFVGEIPTFQMLEDYLPKQKGKLIELREHQQAALASLQIFSLINASQIKVKRSSIWSMKITHRSYPKRYLTRFRMRRNAEHCSKEISWAIGINIATNILLVAKYFAVTVGIFLREGSGTAPIHQRKLYGSAKPT